MNAIAGSYQGRSEAGAGVPAACFHCGLPVPAGTAYQVRFDGLMRPMCCVGCEAVARTIIEAGLDAYYRERTARPEAAPPAPAALAQAGLLFGLDSVQADYVSEDGKRRTAELYVDGITCSACVWLAESALKRLPGVTDASVNQMTHRASVAWDASRTDLPAVLNALQRVGLGGQPATAAAALATRRASRRRALIGLGVALLSMMQVMMFTVPLYFAAGDDVSPEARQLMGWAAMVLTLPAMLYSGRGFFYGAWRDLRNFDWRRISMDLPIAIAIAAGFGTSCVALSTRHGETYFDSISMFIFLLLAARYLESSARESSLSLIERLTNAAPALAWRMSAFPADRHGESIAVAELKPGDVIRIATGEMVAADGVIIEAADGEAEFDESLLTGESLPVKRRLDDALVGGSLNLGSPVLMRVLRTGEQTVASTLRHLTEQALAARPRLVQLADRIARWIAPLTLLLSGAAALAWLAVDPAMSFPVAIAVLAVTCPCALALAAPAAQALAISRLAREGLLVTRADTLEHLAAASDVIFDKTGTLTSGQIALESVRLLGAVDETGALAIAAALESGSPHPIARALTAAAACDPAADPPRADDLRSITGAGVEGRIDGVRYRLGQRAYVEEIAGCPPPAGTGGAPLLLAKDGGWLAAFELADPLKSDAAATVGALRADGLRPHLLSGDRQDRVSAIAGAVSIPAAQSRAQLTPQQKLDYAQALQSQGALLVAVGDGVNDAPLMGRAQVSIAMGRGADLTRLTADAVLLSPSLRPLASARRIAVRMNAIIRQNFYWAIAYNAIAVPLAMIGRISPAWAAIGMASSSLIVVANSLRLLRRRGS